MGSVFDLNPVSHITVGTVGPPGQRIFYLQAAQGTRLVTLIIEKTQALALVSSLDDLLAEVEARFPRPSATSLARPDMRLREPIEPLFRVGQIGLGYDERADLVVVLAYELGPEGEEDLSVARLWATRDQIRTLRDEALVAVEGGRPNCPLCGELVDPQGHLCTRTNGHGNNPKFHE